MLSPRGIPLLQPRGGVEAEARGDAAMLVHVDGHVLDVADEQAHLLADVHVSREQLALILGIIHVIH